MAEVDDWGCDHCRNDGWLIEDGGTPRCPKCDAEFPADAIERGEHRESDDA